MNVRGCDTAEVGYPYRGNALRHVAMPMGGIGAGQIALCGDGGLRQWEFVNQANHLGFVPDSFFVLRACSVQPPLEVVRVLLSEEVLGFPAEEHTPLVNDDDIPAEQRALLEQCPGVDRTVFMGAYPFARLAYEDAALPLQVALEAYSPFVPLHAEASGLPAILFTFRIANPSRHDVQGCLGAALQNAVGWDGVTAITGNRCPLYGGNVNRARQGNGYASILMENPALAEDAAGAGQMLLSTTAPGARIHERWSRAGQFLALAAGFTPDRKSDDVSGARFRKLRPDPPQGPSPAGETWNGGILVPYWLGPGEWVTITFILCWYFPNRYVNFEQFRFRAGYGKSRFWLGNAYARRFADATAVLEDLLAHRAEWEGASRAWADGLYGSTLPAWLAEALGAQGALLRCPTCFWTEDGKFHGFEGTLGASTAVRHGVVGGSCPLDCTHVWNYEQALSRLFPDLERTMRETEFEQVQAPEGYLPHRTVLPLYLPQYRDEPIGGPQNPALDGMLGGPLKVYREVRQGAGRPWLDRVWPGVKRLMTYVRDRWDPDRDGVLGGEQPNTYDAAFYGPNVYMGGLWLAALRATEELAKVQGDASLATEVREIFAAGSEHYDRLLWNGEYYIQQLDDDTASEHQVGSGCLSDQLVGQWWAHQLELGHLLPPEHVRSALQAILHHNFRDTFEGFQHTWRVFADHDDSGLLLCTWPQGGRPGAPMRYCDEVWTGVEYQVGAHCIMEGLVEEGLRIVSALRRRYGGARRNPYNEIECGDHYARAMAGWSVLEAVTGFRYNALEDALVFGPAGAPLDFRAPFVAGGGWGTYAQHLQPDRAQFEVRCAYGEIRIRYLTLPIATRQDVRTAVDGERIGCRLRPATLAAPVAFDEPVVLRKGACLTIAAQTIR